MAVDVQGAPGFPGYRVACTPLPSVLIAHHERESYSCAMAGQGLGGGPTCFVPGAARLFTALSQAISQPGFMAGTS